MVKVKTPSGWKTVNPGQSVGSVSVPGSSSGGSSSGGNSNYNTGTPGSSTLYYITDPNTGKVTVTGSPELAGSSYSSGSSVQAGSNYGTGSKSNYNPNTAYDAAAAARIAQQQEAIRQADLQRVAAQEKAAKEASDKFQAKLSQQKGEQEAQRIAEEKNVLITSGAKTITKTSRDAITKQPLVIKETKKNGHLVREVTNVETGETKTTTYASGKAGGGVRLTGGITTTAVKEETAGAFVKEGEVVAGVGDQNFETISNPNKTPGEIYSSGLGGFISPSEASGQATGFVRPPTIEEAFDISSASSRGDYLKNLSIKTITTLDEKGSKFLKDYVGKLENKDLIEQITQNIEDSSASEEIKLKARTSTTDFFAATTALKTGDLSSLNLTKLETEVWNAPASTFAKLGVATAISPVAAIAGIGLAQGNVEVKLLDIGTKIEKAGRNIQNMPGLLTGSDNSNPLIGGGLNVLGKGLIGASYLVPKSSTEILTDTILEKAIINLPGYIRGPGLTGFGVYETFQAYKIPDTPSTRAEKYGRFLTGGLAIFGAVPDLVTGARNIITRGSSDFVSSKTRDFGISSAQIDVVNKAVLENRELSPSEFNFISASAREYGDLKVEFIPSRSESFSGKVDVLKSISSDINLKDIPSLPKVTDIQGKILDVVRDEGGIVSGSFAQQTLVKDSRPFKDLDILVTDIEAFKVSLVKKIGSEINFETKTITDAPGGNFDIVKIFDKKTKKHLADIDPIKFSEEGLARLYESVEVDGLKLTPPEVRLTSKVIQSARPLPTDKRAKVVGDIAQLLGRNDLTTDPSLLRGYDLSKADQLKLFASKDLFATHGGQNILPRFGKQFTILPGSKGLFYFTPSTVGSGIAFSRKSRSGFGSNERVSIFDVLRPDNLGNIKLFNTRKDVIVTVGRLGKDFKQPNLGTNEIEIAKVIPESGIKFDIVKNFKTILEGETVNVAVVKKSTGNIVDTGVLSSLKNIFPKKTIIDTSSGRGDVTKILQLPTILRTDISLSSSKVTPSNIKTSPVDDILNKTYSGRSSTKVELLSLPTLRTSRGGSDKATRLPIRDNKRSPLLDTEKIVTRKKERLDDPLRIINRLSEDRRRTRQELITPTLRRTDRRERTDRRVLRKQDGILRVRNFPSENIRTPKFGSFGVEVRRGGIFRNIGYGSLGKVLSLGRQRVGSTLAATFKITGRGAKPIKLPGFRTKSTKEGVLFIEKKKRRIKKKRTGSKEVKELKEAKAKKKRSKK